LDSLPTLHDAPSIAISDLSLVPEKLGHMPEHDGRNNKLFRLCLEAARHSDDFDQLIDYARTKNDQLGEPMEDTEVMRAANSAWKYETEGRNYIGGRRAVFSTSDALALMPDPKVGC
jgi:hypothetical protein